MDLSDSNEPAAETAYNEIGGKIFGRHFFAAFYLSYSCQNSTGFSDISCFYGYEFEAANEDSTSEISRLRVELEKMKASNERVTEKLRRVEEELSIEKAISSSLREKRESAKGSSQEDSSLLEEVKKDEGQLRFYTGLPTYSLFLTIFSLCKPGIEAVSGPSVNASKLSLEEQLLLTLMRLRLHLKEADLSYRFHISVSSVSRYINKWVDVMYVRLQPVFMIWPKREDVQESMPLSFRLKYPNCMAVIDCFETFVQRHTDVLDRASTYSSYKHHNTVKFLIAICPTGAITFISQAYGGHDTDPDIVQSSKFLDNILPGDVILADRGFLIQEWIKEIGASVVMPAFKGRRERLTQIEVYNSKEVSNVRIHVERVIGQLKRTFSILQGPFTILELRSGSDSIAFVDKIAMVCCCLINACSGVISR